jgi:hypothetical protein
VQTVALVAVVLLGTIGGFAVLQRNFTGAQQPAGGGSTSTPSPSTATPAFAPIDIPSDPTKTFMVDGLASFPVCGVSMIEGDFLGTGPTYAYVFRKASDAGCDTDTWVVAVQVPKDAAGTSSTFVEGGPLDCQDPSACFVYANPDINGDGQDEIAIVSAQGASTTSFELYEAQHDPQGWGLVPFIDITGMPQQFAEGGPVTEVEGTYCHDVGGERHLVSWDATTSDGTSYDLTEDPWTIGQRGDGALTIVTSPSRSTVTANQLPPDGLDGCGGTIQNSSTP